MIALLILLINLTVRATIALLRLTIWLTILTVKACLWLCALAFLPLLALIGARRAR